MKCHCEAFFAEAIPLFNEDCPAVRDAEKRHFVASLLAMTLIFKRPHHRFMVEFVGLYSYLNVLIQRLIPLIGFIEGPRAEKQCRP